MKIEKPKIARKYAIILVVIVQMLCAVFFLGEAIITHFGLTSEPISWGLHEIFEIASVVGLLLSLFISVMLALRVKSEFTATKTINDALRFEFTNFISEQFRKWGFSSSEVEVAWGLIKGYSNKEIASARGTAEGTIKVQASSLLAKAGVENRQQFMSLFVEEMIAKQSA